MTLADVMAAPVGARFRYRRGDPAREAVLVKTGPREVTIHGRADFGSTPIRLPIRDNNTWRKAADLMTAEEAVSDDQNVL